MNNNTTSKSSDIDYIEDLRDKDATMTRDFRAKYGCSEVHSLSAQALLRMNDLLRTVVVLQTGVNFLALSNKRPKNYASTLVDVYSKAKEIRNEEFFALNSMVIINLCSIIEVSVKDMVLLSLRLAPRCIGAMARLGIKNEIIRLDRDANLGEVDAQYSVIENWSKRGKLKAPDKLIKMLSAVGIDIQLSDERARIVRSLIAVRNCIIHHGGRADTRVLEDSPEVVTEIGRRIKIKQDDMSRFCDGAVHFAGAIATASNQFPSDSVAGG
ncbi:MAG: hypothetical protein WAV67_01465 [Dokdonella sp.]